MADNILKNEFMWQEQQKKKKLYKNWKLYAIALGIIVIGTGTGLGIYYGINTNHSEVTKIALNTLNTSAISGKENMLEQDAFDTFIGNNQEKYTDLESNVEISSFRAPSYTLEGKLVVKAKANTTKYTGSVEITINAIGQTNLNDLNLDTALKQSYTNQQDAFNEFLSNNSTITDLKDNIETGTFTIPTYTAEGKLIVNATTNGKYNGSLEVSIPKLAQIDLNTLNTSAISGKENMLEQDAFDTFIGNNQEKYTDLESNVEISSFRAPSYTLEGKLVVKAKANTTKYTGSVEITINAIGQTNLNDLNLDTALKQSYTNQQDAFNEFLSNNSTITDLKDNIETGTFTIPTYTAEGKLIVNATTNGKYNGSLEVSIPKLAQIDLNTLNTSEITGIENMVEQDAWNAFLNNNSTITDLKDNVETSFDAPTYINTGSLTITAKANSKYSGSIKVTINAIGQTDLNNLNLNKTISGTKEIMNDNTGQEALKTFLNANKTYSDLPNNIEIDSFTVPKYSNKGSLTITAKANSKYTGNITITINELIATDEDIVDTINNSGFTFGADATYNQSLDDFINIVIMGHNDFNRPYDQYWFIKGQLRDHLNDYDILNQATANIEKYDFVKLTDINGNDLTDAVLKTHAKTTIKFVYNFGSMTNQAVDFILTVN